MTTAPSTRTLPILPLPYPQILLPGAKLSILVSKKLVEYIAAFVQEHDGPHPSVMIGAVPVIPAAGVVDSPLKEGDLVEGRWSHNGCSAKLLSVVRPASLLSSQLAIVTLQGLQRIQLLHVPPSASAVPLSSHDVSHPSTLPHASTHTTAAFRAATVKLLTRLIEDERESRGSEKKRGSGIIISLTGNGREALYGRLARLVREAEDDQLPAVADMVIHVVGGEFNERLEYLGSAAGETRLSKAVHIITHKISLLEVNSTVVKSVEEDLSKQQREYILRTQMAAIQRELSRLGKPNTDSKSGTSTPETDEFEGGDDESELTDIKNKISVLVKGSEERKVAVREFRRLKRIPPGSVETSVIRNYLDWLVAFPWPTESDQHVDETTMDKSFLLNARKTLDADHFGLEKVKQRLIEYLAVVRLKQIAAAKEAEQEKESKLLLQATAEETTLVPANNTPQPPPPSPKRPRIVNKGPILLLYGPPGVGKTSIAQSLARALNRPFQRISLGGVRDEAELRGHRRTYVASGPGNIVQALRRAGRLDPVILLDEIDKVSHSNFHGDPAAALLEVLDPEQNWSFKDHYMNLPIDLSQVLFIATANTLDTISAPLLDRCEVIRLPGYTSTEKLRIARAYLIPKQLNANGMNSESCQVEEGSVTRIIRGWTREAGVRNLERLVGAVIRAKAVEWSEHQSGEWDPVVREADLERILGPERFDREERETKSRQGVVYGLVVMGEGEGGILPVETAILPGTGQLRLSGSLGEVIRESAELALSWVKSHAFALGLTPTASTDPLKHPDIIDVHLHLPAGAQKKDGPSAGIAMICAFVSLLSGVAVPSSIAMTGEITLRGAVTPVGGVKEKVLGAHRAGVRKVILPKRNRRDVYGVGVAGAEGVAEEIRNEMEFVFVERVEEALAAAFADGQGERRKLVDQWIKDAALHVESRL